MMKKRERVTEKELKQHSRAQTLALTPRQADRSYPLVTVVVPLDPLWLAMFFLKRKRKIIKKLSYITLNFKI
jgi:hypothetical protein